jgi:hypothetical protein
MKAVTQRLFTPTVLNPVVPAEPPAQREFQPAELPPHQLPGGLEKAVKACLNAGLSESKVIKDILGYQGERYQVGRQVLERIKGVE